MKKLCILKDVSIIKNNIPVIKNANLQICNKECIAIFGNHGKQILLSKLIDNSISPTYGIRKYFIDDIKNNISTQYNDSWPKGFKVKTIIDLYVLSYPIENEAFHTWLLDIFNINDIKNKYINKLSLIEMTFFHLFLLILKRPQILIITNLPYTSDFIINYKIQQVLMRILAEWSQIAIIMCAPVLYEIDKICTSFFYIDKDSSIEKININKLKHMNTTISEFLIKKENALTY